MIRLLVVIALLAVACNKTVPEQTTPTPDVQPAPAVEAVPTETNKYLGVVEFLLDLADQTPEAFASLCAEAGGNLNNDGEFSTCMSGNAGFAIRVVEGDTIGSSILVPIEEGQELAEAFVAEIGEPDFVAENAAGWELPGFVIVFGPVGNLAWIAVAEKVEE